MTDLVSYIKDLLQKGYPIGTIRNTLLKYGYPQQQVDQAIYNINRPEPGSRKKIILLSIISVVIISIAAILFISFTLDNPSNVPKNLLDVSIKELDQSLTPGDDLRATIELKNMGTQKRYDVFLKYDILDKKNKKITSKSETVALQDTKQQSITITLPGNIKEGTYTLEVTARYKKDSPKAHSSFTITSSSSTKSCPATCDDNDPSTQDYCSSNTDYECVHDEITQNSECGNGICDSDEDSSSCPSDCKTYVPPSTTLEKTIWEQLDDIKEIAKTDVKKAAELCDNIESSFRDDCMKNVGEISNNANICDNIYDQRNKERCFAAVAKGLDQPALCENIDMESRKDSCYINFAIDGDYSVCDKLSDQYLKKSCTTMKQTSS